VCVCGRGAPKDVGGSAAAVACGMWAVREGAMAGRVGEGVGGGLLTKKVSWIVSVYLWCATPGSG
jgi:hypothetical protein